MIEISNNNFYELFVDSNLNRIFFRMKGGWNLEEEVPNYLTDWQRALTFVQPGFTILADTRAMKRHSVAIEQLHHKVQCMNLEAGLYQVAEIHSDDEAVIDQIMQMSILSGYPLNLFDALEDAERWLSEIVQDPHKKETLLSSANDLTQA